MIRFFYYGKRFDAERHFEWGIKKKIAGRWKTKTLKPVKQHDTVVVWTNKCVAVGKVQSQKSRPQGWPPGNEYYDTVDVSWQARATMTDDLFPKEERIRVWSESYNQGHEESAHLQTIGARVIERVNKKKWTRLQSLQQCTLDWQPVPFRLQQSVEAHNG